MIKIHNYNNYQVRVKLQDGTVVIVQPQSTTLPLISKPATELEDKVIVIDDDISKPVNKKESNK